MQQKERLFIEESQAVIGWKKSMIERASLVHNWDASFLKYHNPVSVCVRMEMQLKAKVSIEGHQKLQKQVKDLTNQINWKKETFRQDCYNKRLNLLVDGIKETSWETKKKRQWDI